MCRTKTERNLLVTISGEKEKSVSGKADTDFSFCAYVVIRTKIWFGVCNEFWTGKVSVGGAGSVYPRKNAVLYDISDAEYDV